MVAKFATNAIDLIELIDLYNPRKTDEYCRPIYVYLCNDTSCFIIQNSSPLVINVSYVQLMQVTPYGGQICNLCKWRHLVDKCATNASGAIWWTILQLMQVTQPSHLL